MKCLSKALERLRRPDIYAYDDALVYLSEIVALAIDAGFSFRELVHACDLSTPNFFQKILRKERSLTLESAQSVAKGFQFDQEESQYWELLIKFSLPKFKKKDLIKSEILSFKKFKQKTHLDDDSIHENWLHSVVYELSGVPGFRLTSENIQRHLVRSSSLKEIQNSIDFLISKKWIIPQEEDFFEPSPIAFDPKYDKRSVDMIAAHREYLDMAKHRLNDPVEKTEFIGLTVAMNSANFSKLQKLLREATDEAEKLCARGEADQVVALQIGAFQVTEPKKT